MDTSSRPWTGRHVAAGTDHRASRSTRVRADGIAVHSGSGLWFTSPCSFAFADSSDRGRLTGADAVRVVITSCRPLSDGELAKWTAAQQESHAAPFDASYDHVAEHLRLSWGGTLDSHRCDENGHPDPTDPAAGRCGPCPSEPDFRLCVWGIGDGPPHVAYWAGPVVDMRHLVQITGDYR